jgi:hypothetical protein
MPQIVLRSASDIDLKRTLSPQLWAASSVAALDQRYATVDLPGCEASR